MTQLEKETVYGAFSALKEMKLLLDSPNLSKDNTEKVNWAIGNLLDKVILPSIKELSLDKFKSKLTGV